MIRFCGRQLIDKVDMDIVVASEQIVFDENIWKNGKEYFKRNLCYDAAVMQALPVENEEHAIISYAYQDDEANRELRMLKELEEKLETDKEVLQFKNLYPKVREVIVCGCNELAYRFVKYLEKQQINVSVAGKYWNYFGYKNDSFIDLDGADKLVIYAEGMMPKTGDFYQTAIRSASSEFECINRIYEANIVENKIKDIYEDFEAVLKELKTKEVVILGTDARAQDAYDLLYSYGIDICYFADWNIKKEKGGGKRTLLGKKICDMAEIMAVGENIAFINSTDRNSALGTKDVEFFDYYGYKRNENFFFLKDYTDIPFSNLIHVLKAKTVRLVGDERLCTLLSEYLIEMEQGDIDVKCAELYQCEGMKETDTLCIVSLWYGLVQKEDNPKLWEFQEELSAKNISYTNYFSCAQTFISIDLYRNRNIEKYSLRQLMPKGILLGKIPAMSGNLFFRGLLDGHPNILKWGSHIALNKNLFLYCIRLSIEKAENIWTVFEKLYMEEFIYQLGVDFTDWDKFEKSTKELLSLKESFTSQELFMIFHIAYAEMVNDEKIADIGQKVIYWEPHNFPREEFSLLAKWLESEKINGQTVFMHRDNIVRFGSCCKAYEKELDSLGLIKEMSADKILELDELSCKYWREFHVRFEDIKLHPSKELQSICDRLDIPWADILLRTTCNGEASDYEGISDFDLKPVFNKYEENLSEFDRFRVSLISAPYQKKYGYTYENVITFSRKELWEIFLKEFRFQQKIQFTCEKKKALYYLRTYESLRWQLWKVRKNVMMGDITPQFLQVQIGESVDKKKKQKERQKQNEKLINYIKQQKRLILYGIGRDCEALLDIIEETEQKKFTFCDLRAAYQETVFHGKKVLAPKELCEGYKEYPVLVTSSMHYKNIRCKLEDMGVSADRITCNTVQLWEETT